jgi:zinc protease
MCPVHVSALTPVVHRTVLANGLTVVVQEVRTAPLVSVWCWYRVGSGDETPGLTGASHWVEHMNFKGTRHIPAAQMKGIIERHGGTWNGYTWIDQTTYLATAATRALPDILDVEAERMAHVLYEPAECESERTVIISELQGGENDPEQLLDSEVTATALRVHPYGHPTIGWLQDLLSLSRDDLYAHYRRYYVPNNATLVIVGDVDPDHVVREVAARFGALEGREISRPRRQPEPAQIGERRVLLEREGTTGYLKLAFPAPAASDPMFAPALVLDAVLTGAKGVSLWSSFRTKAPQRKSLLYRALVDMGLASAVSGALLPTRLEIVEEAALGAIERVRSGVSDAEVARACRQLRTRMVFDADSVTNIAHQLGFFETIGARDLLDRLPGLVERVSAADVHEAAQRFLSPTSLTLGSFEPRVAA